MFTTLIESRAARTRRTGGSLASLLVHLGVVTALVVASASAPVAPPDAPPPSERLRLTRVETPPPPPPDVSVLVHQQTPVAKGFQVVVPPVDIPLGLPPIDLSAAVTNPDDFTGRGLPNGRATGTGTTAPPLLPEGGLFTERQVERPVMVLPGGAGPVYPDLLRSAGVEGAVLAQFVVDSTGRADLSTFRALASDHALFTAAVRVALGRLRFLPAEAGGRPVAQLVQQSFQFSVTR